MSSHFEDDNMEVYSHIHSKLKHINTDEYVRTSLSLAKETNEELNRFLSNYKLLNKQDVITVAIAELLDKYKRD
jgi:hypothetical protein